MFRIYFLFLCIFSFACFSLVQSTLRNKVNEAFGAPAKFSDHFLPTNLDVAKHFLWRQDELRATFTGSLTNRAVATEVLSLLKRTHDSHVYAFL